MPLYRSAESLAQGVSDTLDLPGTYATQVHHGTNAYAARPNVPIVVWRGTVRPINAITPPDVVYVDAEAFKGCRVYDTFQGETGTVAIDAHVPDVGGAWVTTTNSNGAFTVDTTLTSVAVPAVAGNSAACVTRELPFADYSASAIIEWDGVWNFGGGLLVRADAAGQSGYLGRLRIDGTGVKYADIYRIVGGTATLVATQTPTLSGGKPCMLEFLVSGTGATVTLDLILNGASVVSYSDTDAARIVVGGRAGMRSSGGFTHKQFTVQPVTGRPTVSTVGLALTNAAILPDGSIVAATADTISKSVDGGTNWRTIQTFTGSDEFRCLHRAANGYLFASPFDRSTPVTMSEADCGLWRSTDDGETWTRVITLSAANQDTVWGFDETSTGTLYAGVYALGASSKPWVYRSTDSGATWTKVYTGAQRHIHAVFVDRTTDYVYALEGDAYAAEQTHRSIDGGTTWTDIMPGDYSRQFTCGIAVPDVDCRLFGTDESPYGRIYKTADDATSTVVLNAHYFNFFALRRNPLNGHLYAVGKTDSSSTSGIWAAIWRSTDGGLSWSPIYITASSMVAGDGMWFASDFEAGKMLVSITTGGGTYGNGLLVTDA